MTQKIFVFDYETDTLTEISVKELVIMLINFDREQVIVDEQTRFKYSQINNVQSIIHLFEQFDNIQIIHQDSERDIYVVE